MAYIDNSDTQEELNDAIRGNTISNICPKTISGQVIPVININPKDYRVVNIVKDVNTTASGAVTLYTTPADKDFFLTSVTFSVVKDAACSHAGASRLRLAATINGETVGIAGVALLNLTAENKTVGYGYSTPIKIDRGTALQSGLTFIAGNYSLYMSLQGYTVEKV